MTTTIDQAVHKVENWIHDTLEPALEKEWQAIKPEVVALGMTTLSVIWQAASTYVLSGGNGYSAALAAVKAAIPAEEAAAEHILASALSGAIANLLGKQAAGQPVQ